MTQQERAAMVSAVETIVFLASISELSREHGVTGNTLRALRAALETPEPAGVEPAPKPEDLAKWRLGWERYEKTRKLQPVRWAELCKRALAGERFDDLIDALPGRSYD